MFIALTSESFNVVGKCEDVSLIRVPPNQKHRQNHRECVAFFLPVNATYVILGTSNGPEILATNVTATVNANSLRKVLIIFIRAQSSYSCPRPFRGGDA